ncbi:M1 family aminopeptidase [Archangium lansingense]|uniref:M1 family aminopeptidase n=1 Tax=Archangium lansingense TaxID=2995310 RepID=A0ABT4AEP3_9BACT|nr:M1 family aminopeptidase [Archangium lansinium]MCY1080144.1 M1 family aminopeptidase [Archangium lansinium]
MRNIIAFEWRYHTRQLTFAAAALGFFFFGFALTATGFGPASVRFHSPWLVAESLGFLSLLSVFALAPFSASAIVRDAEHRMEQLLYCTPVSKLDFLGGRFLGSFLAASTAFSFSVAGMLIASFMPWQDAARAAPVNLGSYLWALVVLVLPSMLFAAALMFAIAASTRSTLASYVGAVAVYILYLVTAALTNSPLMAASTPGGSEGLSVAALLDPFGLSGFFEQTRYWTMVEQNTRFVSLSGAFLLNRLATVGTAALLLAAAYGLFSFRVLKGSSASRKAPEPRAPESAPAVTNAPLRTPRATVPGTLGSWLAVYASSAGLELRALFRRVPVVLVVLLWMALAASELVSQVTSGEYGSAVLPTTGLIVSTLGQPLSLLGLIVLVYFSTELAWRERHFRLAETLEATPASSTALVTAKWTALALLILSLIASGIVVGLAVQVARGYRVFEPGLYLSLFYFEGVPLLLFAAVALFLHALSPSRYAGLWGVLLAALMKLKGAALGLEHHLGWLLTAPTVVHSDMNGFGHLATPFHWHMLYWCAFSLLLALGASVVWRRGTGATPGKRLRALLNGWTRTHRALSGGLLAVLALSGGWVLYNTDVLNTRQSITELFDWKADYEKTYQPLSALPQPALSGIKLEVALFPEERRYRLSGHYELVNETAVAIDRVHVAVRREARVDSLLIPGAKLASHDERFGMYAFALDAPLAPGARTELHFQLEFSQPGFVNEDPDMSVVENGSYVFGPRSFPSIGYRRSYELQDPRERRKRGLPEQAPLEDSPHGEEPESLQWVRFDATVSTSGDQLAVAPGRLVRQWEEDGRRYFHYRSETPVTNVLAFASARYQVERLQHGDVTLEVFHHPTHRANVERMLRAAAATLDYMEQHFGPYPHEALRIVEVPTYWDFGAFAMPGMIAFVEDRGVLTDSTDPQRLDLVSRRVVHEVAHQWWGHQLSPATVPGASTLVESLTKYSELRVLEAMYGREYVRRSLTFELDRYLEGRSGETLAEAPLATVGKQPYLYYGKGAVVMSALGNLLGEETVNRALRELLREEGGPGGSATTRDLLAHLRAVSPTETHPLLHDWLEDITLYDLRAEAAELRQRADGRYEVTLRIAAGKSHADGRGNEDPVELHEPIEVGLFREGRVLAIQRHELRSGLNTLSLVLDEKPVSVVVDPYLTRIDRNRFDNERGLD